MKEMLYGGVSVRPAIGGWIVVSLGADYGRTPPTEYVVTDESSLLSIVVRLVPKMPVPAPIDNG